MDRSDEAISFPVATAKELQQTEVSIPENWERQLRRQRQQLDFDRSDEAKAITDETISFRVAPRTGLLLRFQIEAIAIDCWSDPLFLDRAVSFF